MLPVSSSQDQPGSFRASYDRTTKIISAAVCTFLLVMAAVTQNVLVACIVVAVVGVSYAYSPRGYTISEGSIVVKRLLGDARVPLEGVLEARRADRDDFRGCIRLWGNGGLFGYYGLFRTSKLGRCTWYVTNRANAVVVTTQAKTALFSPDDVDSFLAAIPGVRTTEEFDRVISSRHAKSLTGRLIVPLIVAASLSLVAAAVLYSPGPPRYTLTDDSLSIHDLFYRVTLKASDVDVAHIRDVDLTVDKEWRPVARTNGFANSRYQSGWFRVASGRKVRLYRAGSNRLVLMPPKGDSPPVLLEVNEPERFVETVRQRWSSHL